VSAFDYRVDALFCEGVALTAIAQQFGTPCYVYSRAALTESFRAYQCAFADRPHLICYAAKANSNLAILQLFAGLGSGFDIVSGGELKRVVAAGGDLRKTVFSGVGKSEQEMRLALSLDILCFNVESESELTRLEQLAREMKRQAPISLRVNPDVDPRTHPYISTGHRQDKFGVTYDDALRLYRTARDSPYLSVQGIDCHIGSQLTEIAPFIDALGKVLNLVDRLASEGIVIEHIDLGGGLGIRYTNENPPRPEQFVAAMLKSLGSRAQTILLEPGRSLVGNAGVLLTRIEYLKRGEAKNFAVADAAMNDLIRPALYQAQHEVLPVRRAAGTPEEYDVVGPVCESGDFLARARRLAIKEGDLLAIMSAGAYGMSMSSNYNSRPRAAEVMVDSNAVHLIRAREQDEDLYSGEKLLT
jgi:diaminopimelate decarboxylase